MGLLKQIAVATAAFSLMLSPITDTLAESPTSSSSSSSSSSKSSSSPPSSHSNSSTKSNSSSTPSSSKSHTETHKPAPVTPKAATPPPPASTQHGYTKPGSSPPATHVDPPKAATPPPASTQHGYTKPAPSAPSVVHTEPPKAPSTPPAVNTQNGFTKPGSVPPAHVETQKHEPPKASTQHGMTKPPVAAAAPAAPPPSALATANSKATSAESLKAFQAEREKAGGKPAPEVNKSQIKSDPALANARSNYGGNPNTYIERRTTVYDNYRTSNPNVFIYNQGLAPHYGIYDSGFLTGMFVGAIGTNMMSNAIWLAAQQHQPWYPAYRADLERQAADNAELRAKLAAMDLEIAKVKAAGQTTNPNVLPQGVDTTIAIAPAVVQADSHEDEGHGFVFWAFITLLGLGAIVALIIIFNR